MLRYAAVILVTACHANPSPPSACRGAALYRVDDGMSDSDEVRSQLLISDVGGWTYEAEDRHVERGCLHPAQLARLRLALDSATWLLRDSPGDCFAPFPTTHYFVRGHLQFQLGCNWPDDRTRDALVEISEILFEARGRR